MQVLRVGGFVPGYEDKVRDRRFDKLKSFMKLWTVFINNFDFRFDRAVRLFGEDNTSIQPDDFFGIFDAFLTALNEARQDNENMRKRKDEEEKRAKQEAEVDLIDLFRYFYLICTLVSTGKKLKFLQFYCFIKLL